MNQIKKVIKKFKVGKHHLDWIAGLLSIPVLLTVIILNLNNLNLQKKNTSTTESKPTERVIVVPETNSKNQTLPTTTSTCKKEVGPVSIAFPKEGETVIDNPVCINIKYEDQTYCSVVWSYRINNGSWSEFSGNSPCIYNAPNGDIKFELRVQSTVAQNQEKTLTRNFHYQGSSPTATPSATNN